MRTPFLRKFLEEISEINNYYHSFSFLWEEFKLENLRNNIQTEGFTAIIYKDNPESHRYNVKISELENAAVNTKRFILKSLFLQSYFIYETYLKNTYNFCRLGKNELPEIDPNESIMNQIFENLNIGNNLSRFDSDTITYLRLRRNRLIHAGEKTGGEILTTINQKGKLLNKYWSETIRKKSLYGLDFSRKEMLVNDHKEYIDIFTIYRILVERIEKIIFTQSMEDSEIKKAMMSYVMKNHFIDKNKIKRDRYIDKLANTINHEFNTEFIKGDIDSFVER